MSTPIDRLINRLTVIGFCVFLALPALGFHWHWPKEALDAFRSAERRAPAVLPAVPTEVRALTATTHGIEDWFADGMGFRRPLMDLNDAMQHALGRNARQQRHVVQGEDGWLFLRGSVDPGWLTQADPAHHDRLRERILQNLSQMNETYCRRGIVWRVVIAPSKKSIYGDYMPLSCRHMSQSVATDDILNTLKTAGLPVLDLRPALLASRQTYGMLLYSQTDTHWSSLGAYCATLALVEDLRPVLPLHPLPCLAGWSGVDATAGGDLVYFGLRTSRLGLRAELWFDRSWTNLRKRQRPDLPWLSQPGGQTLAYFWQGTVEHDPLPDRAPHVYVIGDSSTSALSPYLNEVFTRITYCSIDRAATMASSTPEAILYLVTERNLNTLERLRCLPDAPRENSETAGTNPQ